MAFTENAIVKLIELNDLNGRAGQKQLGGKGNLDQNNVMNFHIFLFCVLCVSVKPSQEVDLVLLWPTGHDGESQNDRRYEEREH